jgi:hypothetical protein
VSWRVPHLIEVATTVQVSRVRRGIQESLSRPRGSLIVRALSPLC